MAAGADGGGAGREGRRVGAWAPWVQPGLSAEDREGVEAAFAQLEPELRRPAWRAVDVEPASRFDPTDAFAEAPPASWPQRTGAPGEAAKGPLLLDIAAVAQGQKTAEAVWARYHAAAAALQPVLNAFITICAPGDPQTIAGSGPLHGAAIAVKDIVDTAGVRTTGGSAIFADRVPTHDARCWHRLREAGAALVGKTNTHEFAAGTTNENATFGPARNPHAPDHVPGGSSGGSAAAVAAGTAAAAIGTDTGGSVRIPASCCGLVGLKPTFGRISRAGVIPLSWSLDHVGPLAATVADAAALFLAMAGADAADSAGWRQPALPSSWQAWWEAEGRGDLRGVRVGVPEGWLDGGTAAASTAVRQAFAAALEAMRSLGADVQPCDVGDADSATAVNRVIAFPESAAWHSPALDARAHMIGGNVRSRLVAGRFVTAEEYLGALRARTILCRRFAAAMQGAGGFHLLATPTLPIVAPEIGAPPAQALALLRYCAPFNVLGWPAVTLPCGVSAGLPIGLQLAAAPHMEGPLLGCAAAVEAALGAAVRPRPQVHAADSDAPGRQG